MIKHFIDIFEKDKLILWDELKNRFNHPNSHKKTYNMIIKASKDIPTICHVNSNIYLEIKWPDGTIITKLKAKNIYSVINHNEAIISHVNKMLYTNLDVSS